MRLDSCGRVRRSLLRIHRCFRKLSVAAIGRTACSRIGSTGSGLPGRYHLVTEMAKIFARHVQSWHLVHPLGRTDQVLKYNARGSGHRASLTTVTSNAEVLLFFRGPRFLGK